MAKSNWTAKRIGESARSADLTIRLVVNANSMSARNMNPFLDDQVEVWLHDAHIQNKINRWDMCSTT